MRGRLFIFLFLTWISPLSAQLTYVEPEEYTDSSYYSMELNSDVVFHSYLFDGDAIVDSFSFKVEDEYEAFEGYRINASEFEGVDEIFKLTLFFAGGCCSNRNTYYYLRIGEELLHLTGLSNTHCDGPEPYYDYIFPGDTLGGEYNQIYKAKVFLNENFDRDSLSFLSSLIIKDGKFIEFIYNH